MNALRKWDYRKDAIPVPALVNARKRDNARAAGLHVVSVGPGSQEHQVRVQPALNMVQMFDVASWIARRPTNWLARRPAIQKVPRAHSLALKAPCPSEETYLMPEPVEPEIHEGKLNQLLAQVREFVNTSIEDRDRVTNARLLGLDAIGDGSVYADLVAKWYELPNVVIKVAGSGDAFHDFAEAVYKGNLKGKHFPIFHHVSEEAGYGIYVMEELAPLGTTCDEYKYLYTAIINPSLAKQDRYMKHGYSSIYKQCLALYEWNRRDQVVHKYDSSEACIIPYGLDVKPKPNYSIRKAPRHRWDIHENNIMRRKGTGDLVILDPVA